MLLPGPIYIALGPWHYGDFRKIFLPNIGENKKKVTPSEREAWHYAGKFFFTIVLQIYYVTSGVPILTFRTPHSI